MLHILPEAVLAGRRMAEFDELMARFKRQREAAQEHVRRLDLAINLLEQAKDALGPEGLDHLMKALPPPPLGVFEKEPQRTRGILPPSDIAAAVKSILSETGRPMKRGELVAELEKRHIPLAGKDKNKNLGTILWRHSTDFAHLEKLGYWLHDVPIPGVYTPDE